MLEWSVTLFLVVFSLTFETSVYRYDYRGVLFHQSMWNDLYFSLQANFSLKSIFTRYGNSVTCLLPGSLCFELLVRPFVLKYYQSLITWCISWRQKREILWDGLLVKNTCCPTMKTANLDLSTHVSNMTWSHASL